MLSGHGRLLTLGMSLKKSFYLSATKVHLTFQKEQHYGIRRQSDCYVASSLADSMVMNMELIKLQKKKVNLYFENDRLQLALVIICTMTWSSTTV